MKNRKSSVLFRRQSVLLLFFLLFLGGCVAGGGGPSGGLRISMDAAQSFRSATILPDHNYYIQGGSAVEPEAIIGLQNRFQLQSNLWTAVDWGKKELKDAVFWMQVSEAGFCQTEGGYLIAPGGEQIGVWFSKRDRAVVKQPQPGVIQIYPFDFSSWSSCYQMHKSGQR